MSYTERFKAVVGDAYHDRRLAVVRGKMLEYDGTERKMQEAEKQGDMRGAEYYRKQLPAFEEKIKTIWLPEIEKVMVHVRHEREVEKAREEQGFAKAREEAMAKSVVDFSQLFTEKEDKKIDMGDALKETGLGRHIAVGERHHEAKLTAEQVQKIRKDYWAGENAGKNMGRTGGGKMEGSISTFARQYGVSPSNMNVIIHRRTWVHLPRVEGEPEENLKSLSLQEGKVVRKAKTLGIEPVRSELGRLALPADAVSKLRAENKAKKNSPAGE
jgi:hypothetical protein